MFNSDTETIGRRIPAESSTSGMQPLSDRQLIEVVGGRSLTACSTDGSLGLPAAKHFDLVVGSDVHVIPPGN